MLRSAGPARFLFPPSLFPCPSFLFSLRSLSRLYPLRSILLVFFFTHPVLFFSFFVSFRIRILRRDVRAQPLFTWAGATPSFWEASRSRSGRYYALQMTCQIVITPRFKRLYTSRLALTRNLILTLCLLRSGLAQLCEQDPRSSNRVTWTDAQSCLLAVRHQAEVTSLVNHSIATAPPLNPRRDFSIE